MAQQYEFITTTDTRYQRFFAWPEEYRTTTDAPTDVIDGAMAGLDMFYESEFDETMFAQRARADGIDEPTDRFCCLLDFVYVWLVEGRAAEQFPTYEEYLLGIIGIIERHRYTADSSIGINSVLRTASDDDDGFDVFYWGERPAENLNADPTVATPLSDWRIREHSVKLHALPLPAFWGGHAHPALSRTVYDRARQRVKREQLQYALEGDDIALKAELIASLLK